MKKFLISLAIVCVVQSASAEGWGNPLETTEQARQRQSAENYQTYQRQENKLLPPTYDRPLGDPLQPGVERPGYNAPADKWDWKKQ